MAIWSTQGDTVFMKAPGVAVKVAKRIPFKKIYGAMGDYPSQRRIVIKSAALARAVRSFNP